MRIEIIIKQIFCKGGILRLLNAFKDRNGAIPSLAMLFFLSFGMVMQGSI